MELSDGAREQAREELLQIPQVLKECARAWIEDEAHSAWRRERFFSAFASVCEIIRVVAKDDRDRVFDAVEVLAKSSDSYSMKRSLYNELALLTNIDIVSKLVLEVREGV